MSHPGQAPSLQITGRVATITLRRPELANRLDNHDLATLLDHFDTVNQAEDVLVLRLCAEGKYFCSGYNVDTFTKGGSGPAIAFGEVADRLEQVRAITLAVIQGGLYGGASDLALACDFRLGAAEANLFVPAARLGLHFYQGGMERMVSRLGLNTAKRILLLCEKMDAQRMLDCGILTHLLDGQEALEAAAASLSEELTALAPLALLGMKKHLNAIGHRGIDPLLFAEDERRAETSEDLIEGARAWREKRPPVFRGR